MTVAKFLPLVVLFVLAALGVLLTGDALQARGFAPAVLQGANALLFVLSLLGLRAQIQAVNSGNGQAMVRSVLGAVLLKLMVLGAAALVYLYLAGPNKNEKSVLAAMFLYLCYAAVETRTAMRLKPVKKDVQG